MQLSNRKLSKKTFFFKLTELLIENGKTVLGTLNISELKNYELLSLCT